MSNHLDELRRVFAGSGLKMDGALDAAHFTLWFEKLKKSTPAILGERITLTGSNFEKAMKQAFLAGRHSR
jgi:hypothetical protein